MKTGTRVTYEDMANPKKVGTVVDVKDGTAFVIWDGGAGFTTVGVGCFVDAPVGNDRPAVKGWRVA